MQEEGEGEGEEEGQDQSPREEGEVGGWVRLEEIRGLIEAKIYSLVSHDYNTTSPGMVGSKESQCYVVYGNRKHAKHQVAMRAHADD